MAVPAWRPALAAAAVMLGTLSVFALSEPFLVKDINPGLPGSAVVFVGVLGDTLFFDANDGVSGRELWKTDGTAAGTVLVKDINPGSEWSVSVALGVVGETLFFSAVECCQRARALEDRRHRIGDCAREGPHPRKRRLESRRLAVVGDMLFFAKTNAQRERELWKSDGTEAGTVLVKNFDLRSGSVPFRNRGCRRNAAFQRN